jgi:hypothetical protein
MKKTKEELLELKRLRENCKTIIKFKSTFFQILLQGMVDDVPGLVVTSVGYHFHEYKSATISLSFYGIDLEVWLTYQDKISFEEISNVDLFKEAWGIRFVRKSIEPKCSLTKFLEVVSSEPMQILGNELLRHNKMVVTSTEELIRYNKIHDEDNSTQSKKDFDWYKSEYIYIDRIRNEFRLDFSKKLSELLS